MLTFLNPALTSEPSAQALALPCGLSTSESLRQESPPSYLGSFLRVSCVLGTVTRPQLQLPLAFFALVLVGECYCFLNRTLRTGRQSNLPREPKLVSEEAGVQIQTHASRAHFPRRLPHPPRPQHPAGVKRSQGSHRPQPSQRLSLR